MIKLGRERIVEDYGPLADVPELGTSELFDLEDSRPSFCKPQSVTTQENGEVHGLVDFQEVISPHQRLASLQEGLRNTQGIEAKEIRRSTNSVFYLGDEQEKERRRKKRQKDICKQVQAGV